MTKEEFEAGYAERSGVTVEQLHELGQAAVPCDCGHESCTGWAMAGPSPILRSVPYVMAMTEIAQSLGIPPSVLFSRDSTATE